MRPKPHKTAQGRRTPRTHAQPPDHVPPSQAFFQTACHPSHTNRHRRLSIHLGRLRDDNTDAVRLTPGEMAEENAYIQVRVRVAEGVCLQVLRVKRVVAINCVRLTPGEMAEENAYIQVRARVVESD